MFYDHKHPSNHFARQAFELPLAKGVEMSAKLALQQLSGWERILDNPGRSPFVYRGDCLKEAVSAWASHGELSTIKSLTGPEGYPIALEFSGQVNLLGMLDLSARINRTSIQELIKNDPDLADAPDSPKAVMAKIAEMIQLQSQIRLNASDPSLVVYSSPRFLSLDHIDAIGSLANRLVIDPTLQSPQNGFGYKHSLEALKEMSHGFSCKLITLEFKGEIHGFYFMHLLFPDEPLGNELQAAKTRAYQFKLLEPPEKRETELINPRQSRHHSFQDLTFNYSRRAAWADLVAISDVARTNFKERGQHAYSEIHSTMLELSKLYGIERIFGEVRIGTNENLAWQAHQKLGWTMPNENFQRKTPLLRNGNAYALIYLDVNS